MHPRTPDLVDPARLGPNPYPVLLVKYALIALYGAWSAVVGVITIQQVAGSLWGALWPLLIAATALAAFAGTLRSRLTSRYSLELVTTLLLISLLVGYVVAIVIRTAIDGHVERLPIGLLPLILSVFPAARLYDIARPHTRGSAK